MNKNSDKIVGSVLKVTASEELDISEDLVSSFTKSIEELLHEQENTEEEVSTGIKDPDIIEEEDEDEDHGQPPRP